MAKFTLTAIKEKLKLTNQHVVVIGPYKGSDAPLPCKCKVCKHKWNSSWSTLRRGCGCPKCGKERADSKGKLSLSDVKKRLKTMSPTIKVVGEYVNSASPLSCLCTKCDHKWSPTWRDLSQGHGCPKCVKHVKLTTTDIVARTAKLNPTVQIMSEFLGSKHQIMCKCKICGRLWRTKWSRLSVGKGCIKCALGPKISQEEALAKVARINSRLHLVGKYINTVIQTKFKCADCHHSYYTSVQRILRGHGCPTCASFKSEGEVRRIIELLTKWQFPKMRPDFLHGLELDGFNEEHKVAFEYQGHQHYKLVNFGGHADTAKQLAHRKRQDRRKRMQCWRHGIKLIVVPHTVGNKLNWILRKLVAMGIEVRQCS